MSARLVRVGEASLALDPLSSTGVEKALRSGEVAAIAIHTSIAYPGRSELCARFCQERQQEAVAAHTVWTTEFYGSVAHYAEMPFWRTRAATAAPAVDSKAASAAPIAAKIALPAAVRVSAEARAIEEPCIVGEEICMHPAVMHPTLNRPVAFSASPFGRCWTWSRRAPIWMVCSACGPRECRVSKPIASRNGCWTIASSRRCDAGLRERQEPRLQ